MSATRNLMPLLGPVLDYPHADCLIALDRAAEAATAVLPEAADALRVCREDLAARPLAAWEELYLRTFDLAPACAPYVSIHTLGEESWQRAELLSGLAAAYERVGFDPGAELPDHLGVLLRAAPLLAPDEWRDLARLCVLPAVTAMAKALSEARSPYVGVIAAIRVAITADLEATGGVGTSPLGRPPAFTGAHPTLPGRPESATPACRLDFQEDSRA